MHGSHAQPKSHTHPVKFDFIRNIILLLAKVAAFAVSLSYSVLASTIDSVVDLLSQIMVALAER
jgi:divalent metal cation (Fe/Co/Zn/Cd) transporter